jgi:putative phosphonate catabolism associated alcohol dehydrogenase
MPIHPKHAEAVVFRQNGTPLEPITLPIPSLSSGELLVQNACTTLCRSDLSTFLGKRLEKTPTILGHEIVGRVVAFGPENLEFDQLGQKISIGDLITWGIFASDPLSALSKKNIPQKGADLFKYGHEQLTNHSTLHGGLSNYTIIRRHTPIAKLSETIPLKVAAIINCSVATIAGAFRLAGSVNNATVVVSGAGMLGMVACTMAKVAGAQQVIVLDVNEERLAIARRFGADFCLKSTDNVNDLNSSIEADIVIETSGVGLAMENTLNMLTIGGTAVWVGGVFPQKSLAINPEKLIRNLWTIKGLHNYNLQDFIEAVQFMERYHSQFPFEELIHDGFSLSQANEAFAYAIRENPFRVALYP